MASRGWDRNATTRCKWYDDDKKPLFNGCRNTSTCSFVHPDDRGWDSARRGLLATAVPPPRNRGRPSESRARDDDADQYFDTGSWSAPKGKERERDAGWSGSSTRRGDSSSDSRGTSSKGDHSSAWATASRNSDWGMGSPSLSGPSGAWNSSKSSKDEPSRGDKAQDSTADWGTPLGKTTWGDGGSNGWGDSTLGDTADISSGGWNGNLPKPSEGASGSSSNSFGGWGAALPPATPTSSATWESNASASTSQSSNLISLSKPNPVPDPRKGKERATSDRLPIVSTDAKPASRSSQDPSKPQSDPKMSNAARPTKVVSSMGPPPLPSSASTSRVMGPPPLPSKAVSSKALLKAATDAKQSPAYKKELKAKISIMRAKLTPEERKLAHHRLIRYIQRLVYYQIRLNRVKARAAMLKQQRYHPINKISTNVTQQKIRDTGEASAADLYYAERDYMNGLMKLLALPDIPATSTRTYRPAVDREKIGRYTLELKAWMDDLDIPKRVIALRAAHQKRMGKQVAAMEVDSQPPANDETMATDKSGTEPAEPSLDREDLSVAKIRKMLDEFSVSVGDLREEIEEWKDATEKQVDNELSQIRTELFAERRNKREAMVQSFFEVQDPRTTHISANVQAHGGVMTALNQQKAALQARLEEMKSRTLNLQKSNLEREKMLQEAQEQRQRQNEILTELSAQVRAMLAKRSDPPAPPPAPPPPPRPKPPRQITLDDMPPEIREEIVNKVKAELVPVMDGLKAATTQAGEEVRVALEQMVDPIVKKMANLLERAQAQTNGSVSQP